MRKLLAVVYRNVTSWPRTTICRRVEHATLVCARVVCVCVCAWDGGAWGVAVGHHDVLYHAPRLLRSLWFHVVAFFSYAVPAVLSSVFDSTELRVVGSLTN